MSATLATPIRPAALARLSALAPGVGLCGVTMLAALAIERIEARLLGHVLVEALVLAILIGTFVRTAWKPPARLESGIGFAAKTLLEVAVVLLGASLSAATLLAVGPLLLGGIALTVLVAIGASYLIGRLLGLGPRLAALVACGNSICGNSAIAAVAPVIDADPREISAAIAFTAVLGILVVLGLPILDRSLGFGPAPSGVLAGLTVYAVPQVLAAAAPAGPIAVQIGTLVKLTRVLMLGPVILLASVWFGREGGQTEGAASRPRPSLSHLLPWFIIGFLALAGLRSFGVLPAFLLGPAHRAADGLTILSMAALGLSTDLGSMTRAGPKVTLAVTLSLLVLGTISLGLIHLLHLR